MSTTQISGQIVPLDADPVTLVACLERTPGWLHSATIPGEYPISYYRRVNGATFAGYGVGVPLHDEDPQWLGEVAAAINAIAAGHLPATPSV